MKILSYLKRKIIYKDYRVTYAGKTTKISCRRFKKQSQSPQEFTDKNAVICGNCDGFILPGDEICLMLLDEGRVKNPGALELEVDGVKVLVGCLGWGCPGMLAAMWGRLMEDRKIEFFESPMQKALRTGEPTIVFDISTYRG